MSEAWSVQEDWSRLLLLEDYNTRIVLFCVTMLGVAAGVVGCFTLLRKRALLGDALAHSSLPGIAIAFMLSVGLGGTGKSLAWLLAGSAVSGILGVGLVLLVKHCTRLKEDVGLGASLSIFFGAGMALLGIVQQMQDGHAAGLEGFIYGKTASMTKQDAMLIATVALLALGVTVAFFKELSILCFDEQFSRTQGLKPILLDWILMALVVIVSLAGLQAVGLVLVVALLVIPPAAARFWTDKLSWLLVISGSIGGASGLLGGALSAIVPKLPSGAIVVLTAAAFFSISMLFGKKRGVIATMLQRQAFSKRIRQELKETA